MAEKHYTFLKGNRVENTLVFAGKDDVLAQQICDESGYDSFLWLDETMTPSRWSTYDGKTFTDPTVDYLISFGVLEVKPVDPIPAQ